MKENNLQSQAFELANSNAWIAGFIRMNWAINTGA